jgi:heme/copper-type cytochrome/quinol oxidase subunit 2
MRTTALVFLTAAVLTGAFGYWGTYTKAGRIQYDEMAGMIPWFALVVSILFFIVSVSLFAAIFFKSRKKSSRSMH